MNQGPVLSARGLQRGFGSGNLRSLALREASLDLVAGELTLLMGPSGSGKSTLLAILAALLKPDAGSVSVHGVDLWKLSEWARESYRRKHFGFIFQGYNLFPALTARQQLEIVMSWSGISPPGGRRMQADKLLAEVGLGGKERLRPHQLSGGEKQRVAVARALVKMPDLLFADEPTAALDWKHGLKVVELLRDAAHRSRAAVLLVSHDSRIVPLADRLIEMEDGVLAADGAGLRHHGHDGPHAEPARPAGAH
jgi:putative ABC transport system ATP-binding protein